MAINREDVIQSAEKFVARGRIDAAIREYRKVLQETPSDTILLNRVGDLWVRLNKLEEAVRLFTQTAEVFAGDGFFVKSIAIYKKIIKLDPTRLEVYEKLAELYHRQGLINEARSQYQVLADYYLKHKNAASAISIFQRMAELEPDNPLHHVKLAELYQQQRLVDKAMTEYRIIADLLLSQGHGEEASRVLVRALDVNAADLQFFTGAVLALRDAGHAEEAERLLAAAVERNPLAERISAALASRPAAAPAAPAAPPPAIAAPAAEEELILDLDDEPALPAAPFGAIPASAPPPAAAAPPSAPPPAAGQAFEEIEIEIEGIEPFGAPAAPAAGAPGASPAPAPLPELEAPLDIEWTFADLEPLQRRVRIDAGALERTAEEIQPQPPPKRDDDLVAEAEVFAKYGLQERAIERLREALERNPRHLGAHALLVTIHLEQGKHGKVVALANQMSALAARAVNREPWNHLKARLAKAGYRFEGETLVAPPKRRREKDRVATLLDSLRAAPEAPPAPPPPADSGRIAAALEALASEALAPPKPARLPPREAKPAPPPVPPAAPAPPREAAPAPAPAFEDTGVRWLEELPPPAAAQPVEEKLFEDEAEFFDLAAELERELGDVESPARAAAHLEPREQTLEEIVEGFKKGVAENLSPEDYDTHFNLGIAYREMGLLDEAIGEFQLASKEPKFLVDCCAMLGVCFLEKGLPELAVKWYKRALENPGLPEEQTLGLLYDLGSAFVAGGDSEAAYKTFVELYGINSNYRDVVARLEELGPR